MSKAYEGLGFSKNTPRGVDFTGYYAVYKGLFSCFKFTFVCPPVHVSQETSQTEEHRDESQRYFSSLYMDVRQKP